MDFESYHLPGNASIITGEVPGPQARRLLEKQSILESGNRSYPRNIPIALERARGTIIEDVDGNRFIDFFSGCGVLNLGHNNPEIMADMEKQQKKLIHALDFPTPVKIEFMEELNAVLPQGLKGNVKFNFCSPAGTDAVEAALKIAKIDTQRQTVIAFQGSYHGMTEGALGVTAHLHHRKQLPGLKPGVHFMPYSYCYRCSFGRDPGSCKLECAQYLRTALENPCSGIEEPAAIIVEPVQGEGGNIIPREEFLREIVKLGKERKIPVIFDEIQAGFYRTGPLFSFENFKVIPDIVTLSKGLGGIGMPIALVIYKKQLDKWEKATHVGTFRGNQLSIAAGLSALKFVKAHGIPEYVKDLGAEMLAGIKEIQAKSKYIGDVRGIGLFMGIEYVKNKETKEPYPEIVRELRKKCYENGLLVEVGGHYSNVLRFLPPLITTKAIAQNGMQVFERVNAQVEREA